MKKDLYYFVMEDEEEKTRNEEEGEGGQRGSRREINVSNVC